jgi:hypothetical protein
MTTATVPGGVSNNAFGMSSIAMGSNNNAGDFSFAAGRRARAGYTGAFLWADSTDLDFRVQASDFAGPGSGWPSANNTFNVRATGGVWLVTAVDGTTGRPTAGAFLSPGSGSWASTSDRESKIDVGGANVRAILDQVITMPVSRWRYRTEHGVEHVGPMAQDFHRAFGLGPDERSITAIDADGVAFAAIQGLNAKLEAEVIALRAELAEIRALLAGRSSPGRH